MILGLRPSSSNTSSIRMCASPRAPPPPSASAMVGRVAGSVGLRGWQGFAGRGHAASLRAPNVPLTCNHCDRLLAFRNGRVRPACPAGFPRRGNGRSRRRRPSTSVHQARQTSSGLAGEDSCVGPQHEGRAGDLAAGGQVGLVELRGRWWRRRDSPRRWRGCARAPAAARDSAPAPPAENGERSRGLAQLFSVCSR